MGQRTDLQDLLEKILGSRNVYFQPPESLTMKYPCIVYNLSYYENRYADDIPYISRKRYLVTLIHKDPDNTIKDELAKLPLCSFDRFYVSDSLNHYSFVIYY